MADTKISALAAIAAIATDDVLPIVDTSETATKKISIAQLQGEINAPYLCQIDKTSQEITTANTPQVITFSDDIYASGITRTSSSRFTIDTAGTYRIFFSGIGDLKSGTNKHLEVWLRVNGVDVADSNTRVEIATAAIEMTVAVELLYEFTAGQYFELWTAGDVSAGASGIQWLYTAAAGTAGGVNCPSIIMTCNRISN